MMARSPGPSNRRPDPPIAQTERLKTLLADLQQKTDITITEEAALIGEDETFLQWCERNAAAGMKVDGKPFSLDKRRAMAWLYDQIPSTKEAALGKTFVLMKCSQVGFTVMETLAAVYLAIKFGPATVGLFLPDQNLAEFKSEERFMPMVRSIPQVHALMAHEAADGSGRKLDEGKLTRRRIGGALFVFSWTSGKSTTESIPMDFLMFDEVQGMSVGQIERTRERLSASEYRFTLMGSTPNWPDADIHLWFKQGTQHAFHTRCPACAKMRPLADYFPACIKWDEVHPDPQNGRPGCFRYVCEDGHWIDDPQAGEWIAGNPDADIISAHFPQMLSPTISPGEIMRKFRTSKDKKSFYNRTLGTPWLDPDETPVTLEHMANCVEAGKAAGMKWKRGSRLAFMGIDQMGKHNVVVIKERLPDNRRAVIHLEEVYDADPFARCSELMAQYRVGVCVVENNPNFNEAHSFANRHPGHVFLCSSYGSLPDDMVQWGDHAKLDSSDRRTDEDDRVRYSVRIDQVRCMQSSLAQFTPAEPLTLFPDPNELEQDVVDNHVRQRALVAPRAFHHFTKTAIVMERDEETNQYKRRVKKIGVDPHFSYANLLCDVALARAHGTATFILPTARGDPEVERRDEPNPMLAQLPGAIQHMMDPLPAGEVCGRCVTFPFGDEGERPSQAHCPYQNATVQAKDHGCHGWLPVDDGIDDAD